MLWIMFVIEHPILRLLRHFLPELFQLYQVGFHILHLVRPLLLICIVPTRVNRNREREREGENVKMLAVNDLIKSACVSHCPNTINFNSHVMKVLLPPLLTFGSRKTTGSLLLILLNNNPFALIGPLGITTTIP